MSSSHDGPTRVLDTIPTFESFAKKAFLEPPVVRSDLWRKRYEAAYPEVLAALAAESGELSVPAVVRHLSHVRKLAQRASEVMPGLIDEVEPLVRETLDVPEDPRPLHVLLVGTFAANALVVPIGDDVAVLHCVEWFSGPAPASVLIAHEDTHAWHRLTIEWPETDDLAWRAFNEGLAVQASREAVPDRPEEEYFWYGVEGFENWLPWCRENRDVLLEHFKDALDDAEALEAFFGAGFVEGHWRVGFFVADELINRLDTPLRDLVRLKPDDARAAIREALGA